ERLDLGNTEGGDDGVQRDRQDGEEDDIFDHPQALVQAEGKGDLLDAESARQLVQEFLGRSERAQPAAEYAAPPEQHAHCHEAPKDEHKGVEQEQLPAKTRQERVQERYYVDHGQLCVGDEPEESQGEEEVADAKPPIEAAAGGNRVLEDQDDAP